MCEKLSIKNVGIGEYIQKFTNMGENVLELANMGENETKRAKS